MTSGHGSGGIQRLKRAPSKRAAAIGLALGVLGASHSARAQSDPAAASALFSEGRKLAAQKKYAEACPKFEESQRLDPGIGTQFNLADCWENVGRTASAWALFLDVAAAAKSAGQRDRERVARQRAEKLAPRLSRLTVTVNADHPGLEITRDGVAIGKATWDSPVPIDPGVHRIEASAPGRKTWSETIAVAADGASASLTVPALDALPLSSAAPALPADPPPSSLQRDSANATGNAQRTLGFVAGGVGVAGLVMGGVFGLRASSKNGDAKEICAAAPNACPESEQQKHRDLVDDAKSARTLSIIGFAAGGAALGAGIVLVLTAPTARALDAGVRVSPLLGRGAAGASLMGRF